MNATVPKRVTNRRAKERLMVIDYWRREFKGERDPLRGVMNKFKLSPKATVTFYSRLQIFELSQTRH